MLGGMTEGHLRHRERQQTEKSAENRHVHTVVKIWTIVRDSRGLSGRLKVKLIQDRFARYMLCLLCSI